MFSLPKIFLAADHAGFSHKEAVKEWLVSEGYTVEDCGAYVIDDGDDFTDFVSQAAMEVEKDPKSSRGIVFGGSGQGEAMMANRFCGVRATVYYGGPRDIISLSREHNNANVLSIGARFVDLDTTKSVVWDWLHMETSDKEKYHRRNEELDELSHSAVTKINSFIKKVSDILSKEI